MIGTFFTGYGMRMDPVTGPENRTTIGSKTRDLNGSYVKEDSNEITIGNDFVEIILAKNVKGGIDRIIDKSTGIDLRGNKVPPPVILMIYYWTGSSFDIVIQWDALTVTYSNETTTERSTVTMEYGQFRGNNLNATVTIALESDATMAEFGLEIENDEDFTVRSLYFPVIWGLGTIGNEADDDKIFYPVGDGMILNDPLSYYDDIHMTEYYPSTASMQVMCHYDPDEAGLYLSTDDVNGYPKRPSLDWMEWSGIKHFAGFYQHLVPEYVGNDPELDYHCLVGTFHGDWMDAAEVYKEWAESTPFVSGGKVFEEKDTPDWFSKTSVVSSSNRDGDIIHRSLEDIVNITEEFSDLTGVDTTHLIFAWAKNGAWVGPNYFPPAAGEENFKNATAAISDNNDHSFVYISGSVWRISRDELGYEDWEYFNASGREWVCINEYGQPTLDEGYLSIGWTSARMDPMTDFWHDTVVDNFLTCVDLGVDVIQIDEFPIGSIYPCYNSSHGHPLGYSKNITASYLSILEDARTSGRVLNPDLIMSMEEPSEFYIPLMDTYVSRDNSPEFMIYPIAIEMYGDDVDMVPFFPHVYHEYITAFGEPIPMNKDYPVDFTKQMRRSIARAFVTGEIVSGSGDDTENLRSDVISLYNRTVRASAGYANDYLLKGKPLRPPSIDVEDTLVEWYFYSNETMGRPFHDRSVLNSAWEDDDGRIGHVLVNWDLQERSFEMDIPRYDLDEGNWSVIMTRNGEKEVLLRSTTLPATIDLTLTPDDVCLIEVVRLPDISIRSADIEIPAGPILTGEEYSIDVTFHNTGTSSFQSLDLNLEYNGSVISSTEVPDEVLPGGSLSTTLGLDTTGLEGMTDLKVVVDPGDEISEIIEEDNSVSFYIDILERPRANLSILVLDNLTGFPVPNTSLQLFKGSELLMELNSTEFGTISINGIVAGDYSLVFNSSNYIEKTVLLSLLEGQKRDLEVRLDRVFYSFILVGMVLENNTEDPVPGVLIEIRFWNNGTSIESLVTDSNGTFSFETVPIGMINVTASKEGYISRSIKIGEPTPDNITTLDLYLERELVIEKKGSVHGTITDSETGEFISGVTVILGELSMISDGNGEFNISELEPGLYNISVSKEGFSSGNITVTVISGNIIFVNITMEMIEEPVVLKGSVSGTVINEDGEPIQGAKVSIIGSNRFIITGEDGSYSFDELDEGSYVLNVTAQGYIESFSPEITIGEGEDTVHNLTLSRIIEEKESDDPSSMMVLIVFAVVILVVVVGSIVFFTSRKKTEWYEE